MKILIDTNILFSATVFPCSTPAIALNMAMKDNHVFLTTQNVQEFFEAIGKKAPEYGEKAKSFMYMHTFHVIPIIHQGRATIRDAGDQPILDASIEWDIDIIITGDKDFLSLKIARPLCLSPAAFLAYRQENPELFREEDI